jgi:hypothetical protein
MEVDREAKVEVGEIAQTVTPSESSFQPKIRTLAIPGLSLMKNGVRLIS